MIGSSFIIQANVITIVNYDRHLFIVQATDEPKNVRKNFVGSFVKTRRGFST